MGGSGRIRPIGDEAGLREIKEYGPRALREVGGRPVEILGLDSAHTGDGAGFEGGNRSWARLRANLAYLGSYEFYNILQMIFKKEFSNLIECKRSLKILLHTNIPYT